MVVETPLVFSEIVTVIMEYEIQSHFSPSVHRERFSLKYKAQVFFSKNAKPSKGMGGYLFKNLIIHIKEPGS